MARQFVLKSGTEILFSLAIGRARINRLGMRDGRRVDEEHHCRILRRPEMLSTSADPARSVDTDVFMRPTDEPGSTETILRP